MEIFQILNLHYYGSQPPNQLSSINTLRNMTSNRFEIGIFTSMVLIIISTSVALRK